MLKDKEVKKVATKLLKIEYRFFSKDRERQFKTAAVLFGGASANRNYITPLMINRELSMQVILSLLAMTVNQLTVGVMKIEVE
ncbi:unnamed protein product [Lathyrus oleraceus]